MAGADARTPVVTAPSLPPEQLEAMLSSALKGEGLMIKQDTSQCCRCLCCQPPLHFAIGDFVEDWTSDVQVPTTMYVREDSSWLGRTMSCFFPAARAVTYNVHAGTEPNDPIIMRHTKGTTFPHCGRCFFPTDTECIPVPICCCCCLPYLITSDAAGKALGATRYKCDACPLVPKYEVFDDQDRKQYLVQPDTCIGGLCMQCQCGKDPNTGRKRKCFRIPFKIREPEEPYNPIADAALTDLWSGMVKECCTNRVTFGLKFPPAQQEMQNPAASAAAGAMAPLATKATLMGTALMLHLTMTEHDVS